MSAFGPRADGLRLIRIVIVCVAFGTVVNSAGGVYLYVTGQSRSGKTTSALCVFRGDLQRRVDDGRAFLRKHPRGIPGISATDIQVSIRNQQRTIRALAGIDCPKPK